MSPRFLAILFFTFCAAGPTLAAEEKVTFNKHIAPILFNHCASCHRPGEVAPFSLLTYKDAAKHAEQLVEATAKRVMPPWKAEPGFGEFRDARILTKNELELLAAWSKAGTPEGDAKDLPPTPKFPEGWPLGKPDMVVKMAKPFEVPADGRDQIRVVPLNLSLPEDKVVTAVDFRPGNRSVVHHALVVVDNVGLMRDRGAPMAKGDDAPKPKDMGGRGAIGGLLQARNGGEIITLLGAWVPGSEPQFFTDGYGIRLAKDAKVVLQMHYHPVGKAESDQSEVALYFAKKPEVKSMHGIVLAGLPLRIPPGEKRYKIATSVTLPVDVTIHTISPHMHQVGREMKVTSTLPDGKTQPLVWIKDWDWNWQGRYTFKEPVSLPKGTKIDLEAYYDNSSDNPANPNNPPKLVKFGEQTSDEMCLCFMQITTAKDADAGTLRLAIIQQQIQGMGLGGFLPKKQ
jgi:mono/diheme cytochrome c family protein